MRAGAALLLAALCAACSSPDSPQAVAQLQSDVKADDMLVELASAYKPYQDCVTEALQARQDFNGRLPEMIIETGFSGSLQQVSKRYLAQSVDLDSLDAAARIAATRQTLLALGAFAAETGRPPEKSASDQVRRQMAMIEVMQIMASATSVQCSPSDNLMSWMERANNEYL